MEAVGEPQGPFDDSPEAFLKPRPWLERFTAWRTLIRNGCPAGAGPGAILCNWIGGNCSFNNCPRKNFEEDELITEAVLKVKALRAANKALRQQVNKLEKELKKLKKKG